MNEPGTCINWRDIGVSVHRLCPGEDILPPGRVFRGGKIDFCKYEDIGRPRTILNLRNGEDPTLSELGWDIGGIKFEQLAASNDLEKYDTSNKEVRRWLISVAEFLSNPKTAWPVLIHCRSGKDRTGVVVAMLLKVLGVSNETILDEFLLSTETERRLMEICLRGLGDSMDKYFGGRVDLAGLRRALLGGEEEHSWDQELTRNLSHYLGQGASTRYPGGELELRSIPEWQSRHEKDRLAAVEEEEDKELVKQRKIAVFEEDWLQESGLESKTKHKKHISYSAPPIKGLVNKRITLVRHGESEGQAWRQLGMTSRSDRKLLDAKLTRKGCKQATDCGRMCWIDGRQPELIVVSPLTRALETACHMFPQGSIFRGEPGRMLIHPDIAEIGTGIPENRGRAFDMLSNDGALSCLPIFHSIDASMLPEDWPEPATKMSHGDRNKALLHWLASQPEDDIVMVCHCNFILNFATDTGHGYVSNCTPMMKLLTNHGGELKLCDAASTGNKFKATSSETPIPEVDMKKGKAASNKKANSRPKR